MPLKKFGDDDIFHNTIKTFPKNQFDIYAGKVYYQNVSQISGAFTSSVPCVPTGFKSLYELNVDRNPEETGMIYPFVTKDGTLSNFRTISTSTFNEELFGSQISSSYPLSASITRDYITDIAGPDREMVFSLRTSLNSKSFLSRHYQFNSAYGNKATQAINLISIPSIFYGSSINKEQPSISLKYYVSGTLIGELQDVNKNGELIQVGPSGSTGSGSVAGVVLYEEGFMILTGSWPLETGIARNYLETPTLMTSSWLFYGSGMNDGLGNDIQYVSYRMNFEGCNYIETLTMMAHAEKGEFNHSNNPTYTVYEQSASNFFSGSYVFAESKREIKNTVKSPYPDPPAQFEKTTYISKVGIYDDERNLIGIATVSKPVKKTLDRDLTFKLKLDLQ